MTAPLQTTFEAADPDRIAEIEGRIAVFLQPEGKMDPLARRVNRLTRGALARLAESDAFRRMKAGEGHVLSMPAGLAAEAVLAVKLDAQGRRGRCAQGGRGDRAVQRGRAARRADPGARAALRSCCSASCSRLCLRRLPHARRGDARAEPDADRDRRGRSRGGEGGGGPDRRRGRGGVLHPRPRERAGERARHRGVRRPARGAPRARPRGRGARRGRAREARHAHAARRLAGVREPGRGWW
jgi:hypothetical protein